MVRFLVQSPRFRMLTDGDQTPLGDIVVSQPNNDWSVIEVDDEHDAAVAKLIEAQRAGRIVSFQPENVFKPMGVVFPQRALAEENIMGYDFPTIGLTTEWQNAVDGGVDVTLAIADTGTPPYAAAAAHFPDVAIENVYGGEDTHGHETFCTSRMVGPRGALPRCRRLLSAQALPNGSGTTTTVVQAIRALWQRNPRVISLSLGGSRDAVIDGEINQAQGHGVPCSAAMGNSGWNAIVGSPAAVARYAWGASTFDGGQPAVFTTGGCNWPQEAGAIPGQDVGGAHLDGGYGRGSGTSFSCPVGSAIVGAARSKGWSI